MSNSKQMVLKKTHKRLNDFLQKKSEALPQDFNETRWLQNTLTVLQDTKNIGKMNPISVARTCLKSAFLGLDFFNKECYAIPYGNKLTFITDYKGEIKLAKKYSDNPIQDIYAKVVREGDTFEEEIKDGQQKINFKPEPFNNGDIIGAFAVCLYEDSSMIYETMSKEEIENIRDNFSKMPNSMMWKDTPGEAYKKTVLKRLCKMIPLNFDSHEQAKAFDESSEMEFDNKNKEKESSPFDEPVDVEYEEVDDEEDEENLSDEELADKVAEEMEEDDD